MNTLSKGQHISAVQPVKGTLPFPSDNHYRGKDTLFLSRQESLPYGQYETLAAAFIIWVHRMTGEETLQMDLYQNEMYYSAEFVFTNGLTANEVIQKVEQALTGTGTKTAACTLAFSDSGVLSETACLQFTKRGTEFYLSGLESILNPSCEERYLHSFKRLSQNMIACPDKNILDLEILTPEDTALWIEFNSTEKEYPCGKTLPAVFSATARLYPDQTAISSEIGAITFAELDSRSNQIARYLWESGIQKGDYVSVYMERSIEMITAMLGIMKAGAVYVPLSPDNPKPRTQYIIQDSASKAVLTQETYTSELKAMLSGEQTSIVPVSNIEADESPLELDIEETQLAYIIYTSGSTGNPKGVKIAHKSIVGLGYALTDIFPTTSKDVLTQFFTLTFDASFLEVCPMLFTGARLHLLTQTERVDITSFSQMMIREGITYIPAVPVSVLKQFSMYASEEEAACFSSLKAWGVGGEALTGEVVRLFQNKFGLIELVNLYGPTEATVIASTYKVSSRVEEGMINIPIGKPVHNYKMYVVNENMNICPVGVEGELIIETEGLSTGYLNLIEKTAEVFVQAPFTENLVYRSGDLAKMLPQGEIEFVGRKDLQVKVRGYRVELSEIEDALAQSVLIANTAVVPKKVNGDLSLAVYYSTKDGVKIQAKTLISHLSEKLPSYMIPSYFVELPDIPLSPTGKVDRKFLASLPLAEQEQVDKKPPATDTEKRIAEAWQESLGIRTIGVDENFFELGGHSLKVLGALSLLKKDFPHLKINDFFTYPTIEELARKADHADSECQRNFTPKKEIKLVEHPVRLQSVHVPVLAGQTDILLTGATGYLGSHMLIDLLRETAARLYVLVRGKDQAEAADKLKEAVSLYAPAGFFEAYNVSERVKIIVGDFSKEQLAMSNEDMKLVRANINSIIHCGADVRHFGDKESFEASNVRGTENILALAAELGGCRFHYISTIGIPEDLAMEGHWETFLSSGRLSEAPPVSSLYTNSKLESEKRVEAAWQDGLPVTIIRPGNISSQHKTGIFQKNIDANAVYRMIKSFVLLKRAPKVEANMDFTMVDYASRAVTGIIMDDTSIGGVFHLCNPESIRFESLIKSLVSYGYTIELQTLTEFEDWLYSEEPKDKEGLELAMAGLEGDGAKNSPITYDCTEIEKALRPKGIYCPAPDEAFIHRMLEYAVRIGYLPEPNER
ncbi:amino acid adenylation domain-containing protein [Domibacillus sp.]|uniref:non-ribosomal peptide synthetase family protein n=1 Tax=Domibacillus sp. TaxID=1969783 RepID=UPI002811AA06|nr:amino acid adenylation domain-containing protein [Domibacillus sp.]